MLAELTPTPESVTVAIGTSMMDLTQFVERLIRHGVYIGPSTPTSRCTAAEGAATAFLPLEPED